MSNLGGKNVSEDTDKDLGVDSIVAGANIDNIDSTDPRNPIINAAAGGGEVNTASNVGTGAGKVFKQKTGVDLELKSLKGGTDITISNDTSEVTINADSQLNNTTKGDLEVFTTVAARLPVGTDTQVLTADSAEASGLKWAAAAAGDPLTTKGDIIAFDTDANRVPIGTNDQVLTADSTNAFGLAWKDAAAGGADIPHDGAKVRRTTNQTVTTVAGDVLFEVEDYDEKGFADLGTNSDRFTIPTGVTRINFGAMMTTSSLNDNTRCRVEAFVFNSSDVFQRVAGSVEVTLGRTGYQLTVAGIGIEVVATDYIKLRWQNEDATMTINNAEMHIQDVTPGASATATIKAGAVRRDTNIAVSTFFTAVWETEVYDDSAFIDLGTNDDRMTVPTGVTRVNVYCYVRTTSSITVGSQVQMKIKHFNSADTQLEVPGINSDVNGSTLWEANAVALGVVCVAGDYFEIEFFSGDSTTTIDFMKASIQDVSP